ncbi:glycosyltransferase [Azospirillum formosense]|uniref:Glycosyltransferase n=1 Tax=Azospirillum formosense TaxID=861533 RepID=A0ABX2L0X9_9PROT|nr:glycosyltransferase [Azospirillum formosense]NUB20165.1 glycosyltransferase [Azospirillum formosense]
MRFTIVTYGSQGDIRPYVALGKGLRAAGHSVAFPADREFRDLIERHGLDYSPLSGDLRAVTGSREADGLFRDGINPVKMMRALLRLGQDHALDWTREYWEAARGSDAIIASGLAFYTGVAVAEKLGVPVVGTALQPMAPTRAFPPPMMPPRRFPGVVNYALHLAMMQLVWQTFRAPTNRARRAVLGLKPSFIGPGPLLMTAKWPMPYAFSTHALPRPDDWPDFIRATGFWFLDEADAYTPPPDLAAFLESGPPPVYVGFGSMAGFDPAETTRLVVAALNGRRAVLSAGWGGIDRSALPETVHGLESAPHDWLFPRMSAVVHHGGAGTTAAGLRAGVPAVGVPFMGDQPVWGARLHDLGVAPPPLPRRTLTAEGLARAIEATGDPGLRGRAAALGARIRAEDGVGNAVRFIEEGLAHRSNVA